VNILNGLVVNVIGAQGDMIKMRLQQLAKGITNSVAESLLLK
jgi:hypothetical protein